MKLFKWNEALPYYLNDLIHARIDAGLSQSELAKRIGCRREHLCWVERGKLNLSLALLIKICDELGYRITLEKALQPVKP